MNRFEIKDMGYDTECWLWLGPVDKWGYGRMGKGMLVHRFAYCEVYGEIPEGLEIDHLCRVRHCVNPDHMEPVTKKENILRGFAPSAINARKSHCIHGHKFTFENTIVRVNGQRQCRMCKREGKRRTRIKAKENR